MGGDDNSNGKSYDSDSSTWDYGGEETQIVDSQLLDSPTSSPGNKLNDYLSYDTALVDDELATQVMDFDSETHLVNIGCETQVENFETEIEELDIPDSIEMNATQVFNDFDTEEVVVTDQEGTEMTEVVDDTDEVSDEDSGRRECTNSENLEHTQRMRRCMEDKSEYTSTDCGRSDHTSGGVFKAFTSIRAASMRNSGLIALSKASQKNKSSSRSTLTSEPDMEHGRRLFERSPSHDMERHCRLVNGPENGNESVFGRSTARKLFADGELAETIEPNDNVDACGATNLPTFSCSETDLAGLSYIGSQEPGDASQANALDFVDNFLKYNDDCGDEADIRKSTGGKVKPVLSAKGIRTFAKSANFIEAASETGIFDWDDNLEDEGGGEFFRKKKEAFFASRGRRLKSLSSPGHDQKLGESRDKEQLRIREIVMGLVCTDSKLALSNRKAINKPDNSSGAHVKDAKFRKNLLDELDIQEKMEARFDTQMAAEAMEDLCFGIHETDHDLTKVNEVINHIPKGSRKGKLNEKSHTMKSRKAPPLSGDGVRTRQSKLKNVVNESENLNDLQSDVGKRRGKMSQKRKEVDTIQSSNTSLDETSVKKQRIQNVTPVARRTRYSMRDNRPEEANDASIDLAEKKTILAGFHPKGKRTFRKLSSGRQDVLTQSIPRLTRSKAGILTEKGTPGETIKPCPSVCTTPLGSGTPITESSPICMGDEYLKQSCKKSRIRSSLIQELYRLTPTGAAIVSPNKDTRKRKDVTLIRVLFSRHLDGDTVKQQKKILSSLGASESSSMLDATHFVADDFVRTRNMLEAIAFGKPVVTHLWLESCGQARCHIDEKDYILRDAKKEKEFGFSLPASLAHARQNPLLKGHKVYITPNTKPGKEILASLVKAVHGLAVERVGRNALMDDKVLDGLLILSCEEDYAVCLPFLEKGAAIYSSELLLNGIVTQRLEYERHRLFLNNVKRTRSTTWVKKDDKYKAVGKVK